MPFLINAVDNVLEIEGATTLADEPERVVERTNVRMTVERASVNSILNRTEIDKIDMKIEFNMTNSTDDIILRVRSYLS